MSRHLAGTRGDARKDAKDGLKSRTPTQRGAAPHTGPERFLLVRSSGVAGASKRWPGYRQHIL